jgi:hypothetical protein
MQEFVAPMTQKPPTMRSHTSGSPDCASEGSAGTLTSPLKRVPILALGWVLVLGGIIGLFLPIVPGGFLIVAGALMLSPQCAWLRRALEKYRARSHVLGRLVHLRRAQHKSGLHSGR